MPTYQYACTECSHRFEQVQAFTDPSLTECPECHGKLRKVYGSVGVVFKGSGFYRTDSRSESSAKGSHHGSAAAKSDGATGGDGASTSDGASSSSTKSDSKATSTTGSSTGTSSSAGSSSASSSKAKAAAS